MKFLERTGTVKMFFRRYLPEFVYGSIDGVITTFAIVTASVGAGLDPKYIFILGMANVLADAFSMGSSNYLSSLSELQMGEGDTKESRKRAFKRALVTFSSFVALGSLPVLPFLVTLSFSGFRGWDVFLSLSFALSSFVLIGYVGARVTRTPRLRNIFRTLAIGVSASGISFGVGFFLQGIGGF